MTDSHERDVVHDPRADRGYDDYRRHAGSVSWPRSLADLSRAGNCPACFTQLWSSSVCPVCGLDLGHPAAAELIALSSTAARALDRRLGLIGRIRLETDVTAGAMAEALAIPAVVTDPPTVPRNVPAGVREPASHPASPPPAVPADPSVPSAPSVPDAPSVLFAPSSPDARPRRTSSVQLVMLIVGVSALSVGAIFFLVYAFINYGIGWRSAIIGSITVAAFTAATLLRRLRATAEGVAAFAVVLVYLDAYAVRANDLMGAAGADPLLYWGSSLVLSSIGFLLWHRWSGLRVPSVAGFSTFAPGIGLLVASAAADAPEDVRAWLVFASIAAGGVIHGLAWRRIRTIDRPFGGGTEQTIVLATTVLAVVLGSAAAVILEPVRADATAAILALVATAAIAGLHIGVLRLRRHPVAPPISRDRVRPGAATSILAAIIGIDLAATGFVAVLHGPAFLSVVAVPCITAVAVTLALELASRRATGHFLTASARIAGLSALVVASIATAVPLALALVAWLTIVAASVADPWTLGPANALVPSTDDLPLATITLASVIGLAAMAWTAGGVVRRRVHWLGWSTALLLVLATPLLVAVSLVMASLFVLASGALALLVASTKKILPLPRMLRAPLIGLLAGATVLGWCVGWASESTWAIAAGLTILIALFSRALSAHRGSRAALLGVAVVLVIAAAGTAALALSAPSGEQLAGIPAWTADATRLAQIASVTLFIVSALPIDRFASELDRRTGFWTAGSIAAATATILHFDLNRSEALSVSSASLLTGVLLLSGLLLWVGRRGTASLRFERMAASVAIAPAIYLVVDSFTAVLGLPEFARSVAPITAAVLTAAGSHAVTLLRPSAIPRVAREAGIALVAVPAVLGAIARGDESTWLVLLLASVTVLLTSVSSDGLFGSASPRKHVGWAAIVLATAGFWWRLGENDSTAVEPWVLPVAGLLLIVAILIWRAEFRSRVAHSAAPVAVSAARAGSVTRRSAAPVVALAALITAIVPVAVAATSGPPLRALVVGTVSAALLLLGSFVAGSRAIRPYLDAGCLAGGIGVIVTAVGRASLLVRTDSFELDAWLGGALVVLIVAGFGLAATAPGEQPDRESGEQRDQPSVEQEDGQEDGQPDGQPARRQYGYARLRSTGAVTIAIIALTASAALESIAVSEGDEGIVRALGVTMLFSAVHVLAFLVDAVPFTRFVAWLSIALAAVVAGAGILSGSLDPIEAGTLPVATALLATGTVQLERDRRASSWPWLAPGVTLLLLPSLIATAEDRPIWRLVAIGVVGIAAIVVGATRRLQAPFVLGSVIVLVHVIATFTPQIRAAYQSLDWWLWLALGGILLIVLAARYEQRIQNLRDVARRIGSLR